MTRHARTPACLKTPSLGVTTWRHGTGLHEATPHHGTLVHSGGLVTARATRQFPSPAIPAKRQWRQNQAEPPGDTAGCICIDPELGSVQSPEFPDDRDRNRITPGSNQGVCAPHASEFPAASGSAALQQRGPALDCLFGCFAECSTTLEILLRNAPQIGWATEAVLRSAAATLSEKAGAGTPVKIV